MARACSSSATTATRSALEAAFPPPGFTQVFVDFARPFSTKWGRWRVAPDGVGRAGIRRGNLAMTVVQWDGGAGGDVRAIGLRFTQRATPHPALRATFPTSWRRGRDGRCEDQGRREGCMVSTRGISHSSISRRVHHRRTADRHRAHSCGAGGDVRAIGPRFMQRAIPHPALRATFPTSWRRERLAGRPTAMMAASPAAVRRDQ